jgi:hypothetical protein
LAAKENHDLTFVGYGGHFVFKNIFTKNILTQGLGQQQI